MVSKHLLYESSVQSPRWQVDYLPQFHRTLTGKLPLRFREDFCGTARISCEWARKSPRHFALGVDLDPEVLSYAQQVNIKALPSGPRRRVALAQRDVRRATPGLFDWIGVFNYSFYEFHERRDFLKYARSAFRSLATPGTLFLEMAGGPGFAEVFQDLQSHRVPGVGNINQVWEQHGVDPISAVGDYSIHFQLPSGEWMTDAFRYHWRIWTIREVREVLAEAGFARTVVLWEKSDSNGEGTGELELREDGDSSHTWTGYVVGVKG